MYDKQAVIELAYSQLGYHEKASNADLDDPKANSGDANWTKYARDLDQMSGFYNGPKNSFAWCDVFVDWCFATAYGRAGAQFLLCQPDNSAGAGCSFSAQYFNSKGQFHKSGPQLADQIFFGSAWNNIWHTGLVVDVNGSYVTTIEGNSSDMVAKRTYRISDPNIFGYGRPEWGEQPVIVVPDEGKGDEPAENPTENVEEKPKTHLYSVELPLVMIGDEGPYVKAIQALLIARGYDCGNRPLFGAEKPDGDFGRMTEKAIGFFQSHNELEIDGEVGGQTWAALLGNWG